MKTIAGEYRAELKALYEDVRARAEELEAANETFNDEIETIFEPLRDAVSAYNEVVQAYNAAIEVQQERIETFTDRKGEAWLDEHGDHYEGWKAVLGEAMAEEVDEPEMPSFDLSGASCPEQMPPLRLSEVEA